MIFPDLKMRLRTSGILLGLVMVFLTLSAFIPLGFLLGIGLIGSAWIVMREWWELAKPYPKWRIIGILGLGFGFSAFFWLFQKTGWRGVLYVISIAIFTDIFAYLGGNFLGGPKLCPWISPNKTWSGALVSLIISSFLGTLLASTMWPSVLEYALFGMSLVLCFAAQGGDWLESWIKRRCCVKDVSTLLPGHGGALDRIDSWLMAACIALALPIPSFYQIPTVYQTWIDKKGNIQKGLVRETLKDLFQLSHLSLPNTWHIDEVTRCVQGNKSCPAWFLPGERWNMHNSKISSAKQARAVLEGCNKLLYLSTGKKPQGTSYQQVFIMGTTVERFAKQLDFLNKHRKSLASVRAIYILTGERALEQHERAFLKTLPILSHKAFASNKKGYCIPSASEISDESDAMAYLFACLADPSYQKKAVLMQGEKDVKRGRATTATTVKAWLNGYKKEFSSIPILLISNAPFIEYQTQVTKNLFGHNKLSVEGVGAAWPEYARLNCLSSDALIHAASVGLDTLSRLLYELQKAHKILEHGAH